MPRFTPHSATSLTLPFSLQSSSFSSSFSHGFVVMEGGTSDVLISSVPSFARGLRILLVDHETTSLMYIASMLELYSYQVTTTELATVALSMIWKQKNRFHLVMANVSMPDMDIFTFLKHTKDMPVILMSSDRDVNKAKRCLCHGACFFLEKPISIEDLKYVWQHACRKKSLQVKETGKANCEMESQRRNIGEMDRVSGTGDNLQYGINHENRTTDPKGKNKQMEGEAGVVVGNRIGKSQNTAGTERLTIEENEEQGEEIYKRKKSNEGKRKYKKRSKANDLEQINSKCKNIPIVKEVREMKDKENGTAKKKNCPLWNSDLHFKFTTAVSALGEENARPKSILELMREPNLTPRQVASHLQKFKARVHRINETSETNPPFGQSIEPNSTSSLVGSVEHSQGSGSSSEFEIGADTTYFTPPVSLFSPELQVENSVQHNLTTPNLEPGYADFSRSLIDQPHFHYKNNFNQVRMASFEELHGLNQATKTGTFSNGVNMNNVQTSELVEIPDFSYVTPELASPINSSGMYQFPNTPPEARGQLNPSPDLLTSFGSQNPDQHPMTFTGLTQEPNFETGQGNLLNPNEFPTDFTNGNQELELAPTDNFDFTKELEELGDLCSGLNTGDVGEYYEWLKEALIGNSAHPPQF